MFNHENKSQNNDIFNVYEYRFINIEKTSTFINEIYHNNINFLMNEKLHRVSQFFQHIIYFDVVIKQRFNLNIVN